MHLFPEGRVAGFRLRPQNAGDLPFLAALMASAREAERAAFGGDPALWDLLMEQQVRAQTAHYTSNYRNAFLDILLDPEGAVAGRLCLSDMADEIRIMDIALRRDVRGKGQGTAILQAILRRASDMGKVVRLHVEETNRARQLYRRLGFRHVCARPPYEFMECAP